MRRRLVLVAALLVGSSAMFVGGGCSGHEEPTTPPEFLTPIQDDGTCSVSPEACKALDVELLALLPTDEERRLEPELGRCGCVILESLPGAESSEPMDGVCPNSCSVGGATLWGVCPFDESGKMGDCICRCLIFPQEARRCLPGSDAISLNSCDIVRVQVIAAK